MSGWKKSAIWGERVFAIFLALVTLAIIAPDLGSVKDLPNGRQKWIQGNPLALAIYSTLFIACVAGVIVGQRRWKVLRGTGWAVMFALFALKTGL